jgi:hypothetical protein
MKVKPRILEQELNRSKLLMEFEYTIVNKSDLDDTWSAAYLQRKKQGLFPYLKNGYTVELLGNKASFNLKKAIYMTPEQAAELNDIGSQIRELTNQYNEKYQQYAKE